MNKNDIWESIVVFMIVLIIFYCAVLVIYKPIEPVPFPDELWEEMLKNLK